jgi:hypothetical protein
VAEAAEVPGRDSAVAGQAEVQEDREAEPARAGAAARVRAEVSGKRVKLREEAAEEEERARAEEEERARAEEEDGARAAVAGEQAPVAEAVQAKELAVVEGLAVDLDRADQEVVGLEVVGPEVAGLEVAGLEAAAPVETAEDMA